MPVIYAQYLLEKNEKSQWTPMGKKKISIILIEWPKDKPKREKKMVLKPVLYYNLDSLYKILYICIPEYFCYTNNVKYSREQNVKLEHRFLYPFY